MDIHDEICVLDTSALIDVPDITSRLISNDNIVVIPWKVHDELNNNKRVLGVGKRAQKAIKDINSLQKEQMPQLKFMNVNWHGISDSRPANILNPNNSDDVIIASALSAYKEYQKEKDRVYLFTHDFGMQIKAREMKFNGNKALKVMEWTLDQGFPADKFKMPELCLGRELVKDKSLRAGIPLDIIPESEEIFENCGMLVNTISDERSEVTHVARCKNGKLILLPREAALLNIVQRPIKKNGDILPNWEQIFAINSLLDLDVFYHTLIGDAGTGKTIMALASAFHFMMKNNRSFEKLYITRAPVPVGKTLGYAPGTVEEKMGHWVHGMLDNIGIIKKLCPDHAPQIELYVDGRKPNGKEGGANGNLEPANGKGKRVEIMSYEHIRGRSLDNSVIIIDEVQNMRPEDVTTFVTRPGEGTRIIMTGDPSQIDDDFLSEQRNGLVWFAKLMRGDKYSAYTYLPETVRSPQVQAFLQRLRQQKAKL